MGKLNGRPAWLAPAVFTGALLATCELALRLSGFQYSPTPIGLRYAATIAHIGGGNNRFHVDYKLDPVLLWRPIRTPPYTNDDGFVGPDWQREKKPGAKRVITLGDSCTIAGDPTYAQILGGLVSKRTEVLNAGVGSWSSYQGLQLLRAQLLDYRPDAVTIYFGWNDHWLAWAAPDKALSSLISRQWRLRNALNSSRVLQALTKVLVSARGEPRFGPATPYRVAVDDYEANLREMVRLVKAAGGAPVLVTAPTVLTPDHPVTLKLCRETHNFFDPRLIQTVHAAYNERVRKVARETGSALVDLAADFAAANDPRVYFTDGIHLSSAGNERAARELAAALGRIGI